VICNGKPAHSSQGKPAFFSETGSIMKFPKKTAPAAISQDTPVPELQSAALQHRYHWINAIRNVLSRAIFRRLSWKSLHADSSAHHHLHKNSPMTFRDYRMTWIKTGRSSLSSLCPTINHLEADDRSLSDQSILCIGGRAALYADYHRLIEAAGGHLMIFRSAVQNNTDCLYALLDRVNIVICPVDCINHADFLAVRRYCQRTRKYCAMLQRSDLLTFNKAVETLIRDNASSQKTSKTYPVSHCFPPLNVTGALAG